MLGIILQPLPRAYDIWITKKLKIIHFWKFSVEILQILSNLTISDPDLYNPHQTTSNNYPLQANEIS